MTAIVYLATADARGHLMRAQLLVHALRERGAAVRVLTTSDAGVAFFADFGIDAQLLSRHYAVQFDSGQNMRRGATDANIASYLFHPGRMARDLLRLRRYLRGADLIVNDSFHPALLTLGCLPGWRHRIVHVYGSSLRAAVENNFGGRAPGWISALFAAAFRFQVARARARLEHHFAYRGMSHSGERCYRLPTPVALAHLQPDQDAQARAAVYLNPHFCDTALAAALEQGLGDAGLAMVAVGEGYAGRPGWRARDPRWIDQAAASAVIVSAPGMAALSVAVVYRRPIVLLVTDQPEQRSNAARARELGLRHAVVMWEGDAEGFSAALAHACRGLKEEDGAARLADGAREAAARLDDWAGLLLALSRRQEHGLAEQLNRTT